MLRFILKSIRVGEMQPWAPHFYSPWPLYMSFPLRGAKPMEQSPLWDHYNLHNGPGWLEMEEPRYVVLLLIFDPSISVHLGAAFVSVKGATSIFFFPGLRRRGLRLGTWGYSASIAAPQIVSDHGLNMSNDTQWLVPSPHRLLGVKNKVCSRKLQNWRFCNFPRQCCPNDNQLAYEQYKILQDSICARIL